jgi:hypothetical protein
MQLAELQNFKYLRNQWVAIDPRGGQGVAVLRNGCVVVDFDVDVGDLCARLETKGLSSLEIRFCASPLAIAA